MVSRTSIRLSAFNLKELESLQKKIQNEIKKRRSKTQEEGLKKISYNFPALSLLGLDDDLRALGEKEKFRY